MLKTSTKPYQCSKVLKMLLKYISLLCRVSKYRMLSINLKLFTVDLAWLQEHKLEALGSSTNSFISQLCNTGPQFTHL